MLITRDSEIYPPHNNTKLRCEAGKIVISRCGSNSRTIRQGSVSQSVKVDQSVCLSITLHYDVISAI